MQGAEDPFLFDEFGVDHLSMTSVERYSAAISNVEVWALADQTVRGVVDPTHGYEWLVLVTSSPREKIYKSLRKEYSAPLFFVLL